MQRTQASILDTEERAAVIDRAKSHLELEKQRISQLLSMLSDFSTQAALLAGCAIAGVSGESLDSMDDEEHTMGHAIGATIFISSGAKIACGDVVKEVVHTPWWPPGSEAHAEAEPRALTPDARS